MKAHKRLLVFAVILILIICSLLVLSQLGDKDNNGKDEEANSSPADDTGSVKISAFNWTSGWGPGPVGLRSGRSFNITITNFGTEDLDGWILTLKMSSSPNTRTNPQGIQITSQRSIRPREQVILTLRTILNIPLKRSEGFAEALGSISGDKGKENLQDED
jgi:hypothetical protein